MKNATQTQFDIQDDYYPHEYDNYVDSINDEDAGFCFMCDSDKTGWQEEDSTYAKECNSCGHEWD